MNQNVTFQFRIRFFTIINPVLFHSLMHQKAPLWLQDILQRAEIQGFGSGSGKISGSLLWKIRLWDPLKQCCGAKIFFLQILTPAPVPLLSIIAAPVPVPAPVIYCNLKLYCNSCTIRITGLCLNVGFSSS